MHQKEVFKNVLLENDFNEQFFFICVSLVLKLRYSRTPIIRTPTIRITDYPNRFQNFRKKIKTETYCYSQNNDSVYARYCPEGCSKVNAEDIGEWMVCDSSDHGLQILNDDELIVNLREESVEKEDHLYVEVEADTGLSASEAFVGLETVLKWMQRHPKCDHKRILTVKRMRDLAARDENSQTAYFAEQ